MPKKKVLPDLSELDPKAVASVVELVRRVMNNRIGAHGARMRSSQKLGGSKEDFERSKSARIALVRALNEIEETLGIRSPKSTIRKALSKSENPTEKESAHADQSIGSQHEEGPA